MATIRGDDASQQQRQEAGIETRSAIKDSAQRVGLVTPGPIENGLADAIGRLPPGRCTLRNTRLVSQMRRAIQRDLAHAR